MWQGDANLFLFPNESVRISFPRQTQAQIKCEDGFLMRIQDSQP